MENAPKGAFSVYIAEDETIMKAYDMHENKEIEVTYDDLIDFLNNNRQIDLILKAPVTDSDGYLTWDKENWINIDGRKYQRNYFLGDRALRDYTHHNIYDLKNSFKPEEALRIEIN